MWYVSDETYQDTRPKRVRRKGGAQHVIVLRHINGVGRIECGYKNLPEKLYEAGVELDNVCGLARRGTNTVRVTPLIAPEVSFLKLIKTTEHIVRDTYVPSAKHYGSYNYIDPDGMYSTVLPCSVAKFLFRLCPDRIGAIGGMIETDRGSITVSVSDSSYTHIRYYIESFDAFDKLRKKYVGMHMDSKLHSGFDIWWKDYVIPEPKFDGGSCRILKVSD